MKEIEKKNNGKKEKLADEFKKYKK